MNKFKNYLVLDIFTTIPLLSARKHTSQESNFPNRKIGLEATY